MPATLTEAIDFVSMAALRIDMKNNNRDEGDSLAVYLLAQKMVELQKDSDN